MVQQLQVIGCGNQLVVDVVQVQLLYICILVLMDGCIGLCQVDFGNLVCVIDMQGLVMVQQIDLILVVFVLLQDVLLQLWQVLVVGDVVVQVLDCDGGQCFVEGILQVIDNQIDEIFGMVWLCVCFVNVDDWLWFGQLVSVWVCIGQIMDVLVVDVVVIQCGVEGSFVYCVVGDGSVEVLLVIVGEVENGQVVIQGELWVGDVIVCDGQLCLCLGVVVIEVGVLVVRVGVVL